MTKSDQAPIAVLLETGQKRVFAGALDWPGWCRAGRDEPAALEALLAYGGRYADVVNDLRLGFAVPRGPDALEVVEPAAGNATTDFGAPGAVSASDARPVSAADLARGLGILRACWSAFDRAVNAARGRELRKGPRGGGRELDAIVDHVLESEAGYLGGLAWKVPGGNAGSPEDALARTRDAVRDALTAAAEGRIEPEGPRGGRRWSGRYFVRREAWHVLDHSWEIEDRASG